MRAFTRAAVASLLSLLVVVPAAGADTLPGRDTPFTPSQAVADQYLTPPVATPPGGAAAAVTPPGGVAGAQAERGVAERGVAGDQAEGAPAEGVAPAAVEQGATAPRPPSGSLPFTGNDLLALVWIALALLAAGTVAELARRRIEAARARTGT